MTIRAGKKDQWAKPCQAEWAFSGRALREDRLMVLEVRGPG